MFTHILALLVEILKLLVMIAYYMGEVEKTAVFCVHIPVVS